MACPPRCHWYRCLAFLLSMIAMEQAGRAQSAPSREELREPVYRVEDASSKAGVRPVVEATPVPGAKSTASEAPGEKPVVAAAPAPETNAPAASSPATTPAVPPDAAISSTAVPPANETKVASLAPTVRPAISEPQRILNEAVEEAKASLKHIRENVDDYTCLFIKREKVHGEVLPTEFIETKVRNRKVVNGEVVVPFAVHMRFIKPAQMRGREAIYIEGQFNDQVRVKEGGTRGKFLPSVLLNPTGRFALQDNRYPITEIGIENLVQRLIERSQADTAIDVCEVTFRKGASINGRPCKFLQVKRPTPKTGEALKYGMNVYLAQVFIDEELNVPIRYAAYDWPLTPGGPPEVAEEYTYQNLKVNVGLTDKDFDYQNPEYNF